MKRPQAILLFLEENRDSLPYISEEFNALHAIFNQLQTEGRIELRSLTYGGRTSLEDELITKQEQVSILHIAGHCDGRMVSYRGEQINFLGLAEIIVKNWQPRFIFLNACNTNLIAKRFLALGVSVVIFSGECLEDKLAAKLAVHFYKLLIKKYTILEAFDTSKKLLWSGYGDEVERPQRNLEFSSSGSSGKRQFPLKLKCSRKGNRNLTLQRLLGKRSKILRKLLLTFVLVIALASLVWGGTWLLCPC